MPLARSGVSKSMMWPATPCADPTLLRIVSVYQRLSACRPRRFPGTPTSATNRLAMASKSRMSSDSAYLAGSWRIWSSDSSRSIRASSLSASTVRVSAVTTAGRRRGRCPPPWGGTAPRTCPAAGQQLGRGLGLHPRLQLVGGGAVGGLEAQDREPGEAVVQREVDGDAVVVGVHGRVVVVCRSVGMRALVEAAAVVVQPPHLLARPGLPLLLLAPVHPVDRQVRPGIGGLGERARLREAEVLKRSRGDPASAAQHPRADHAPGVEVVALVPAVG